MTGMPPGPEMAKPSAAQLSPVLQPSSPARLLSGNGGGAAPTVSTAPNASRLTFDDVAKHFNVPIAEAATALGVCSSVLKRICRENGVVRWPYRKFLAGKTVDDIKKDAAKEKSKEFAELSKVAKEILDQSTSTYSVSSSTASTMSMSSTQDGSKLGKAFSVPTHNPQQPGAKPLQGPGLFQPLHSIPNYVDEFKYGFPVDGLSLTTRQWWGSGSDEGAQEALEPESTDEDEKSRSDGSFSSSPDESNSAASFLCSVRRQAVNDGEESIKLGVSRGYGCRRLGKRERSVLAQVFRSSLPCEWKQYFS